MIKYPDNLAKPLVEGYALNVDMGVDNTAMNNGMSKQRRRHRIMHQKFTVTFMMGLKNLREWQLWVNDNAYDDWFALPLTSYASALEGKHCSFHKARFISDLEIVAVNSNVIRVTVEIEAAPEDVGIPATLTNDWIVAKDPADPSAPDWFVAGTPAHTYTDDVHAGTPQFPAARV